MESSHQGDRVVMAVRNTVFIAGYGPLQHSHQGDRQEIAGYGAGYGLLQRSHQGDHQEIGLFQLKEEGWTGFYQGWQGCSEGFPGGKAQGKSRGAALSARENPVHPDSFTWIYILFKIGYFGDLSDFFQIFMFEKA